MLWRHGQTAWNLEKRFQGSSDVELDETGHRQARAAAQALALLSPDKIVASDLKRAKVTAEYLSNEVGLPVITDARLQETAAGDWEGKTREQLLEQYADGLAAWVGGSDMRPGGGERRSEVAARMISAIGEQLSDVPDYGVLVVASHGGSTRAAIGALLDLPMNNWGMFGVLSNCAWCVLVETDGVTKTLADGVGRASNEYPDVPPTPPWRLVEYNAASLPAEGIGDDSIGAR